MVPGTAAKTVIVLIASFPDPPAGLSNMLNRSVRVVETFYQTAQAAAVFLDYLKPAALVFFYWCGSSDHLGISGAGQFIY